MILKDFQAGLVYKLHDGTDPHGLMGMMLRDASPAINRGRMSAKVAISRQTPDRSRDVVVAKGGRFANHCKIPIACVSHNRNFVAGMAEDPLKNYTVKTSKDGNGVDAETYFSQSTELGLQSFRLVESGVFRGASIGFIPVGVVQKSHAGGVLYPEWELIEYSHLPIPDHPDCIVEAVFKGFSNKPLCPELDGILRPMCPPKPEIVTSGWDAETVAKAGTFKTAEPKEAEPLTRSSVYYVCPHCGKEMSAENIFRDDEDGTTRHGECRGAIILKPATPMDSAPSMIGTSPAVVVPKSLSLPSYLTKTYQPRRFLPGIHKAFNESAHKRNHGKFSSSSNSAGDTMQTQYDDPNGDTDLAVDDSEFLPDDDAGTGMKAGAEFNHGLSDIITQALQFIEDGKETLDNQTAIKSADKVTKWLSKALKALHDGHQAYLGEHPDQPELPGAEGVGDAGPDDDEDDDLDDDDDSAAEGDDDLDAESDDESADDDSADDKPKKKKGKPAFAGKSASEWRTKALNSYWEDVKRNAVIGDGPILKAASDVLWSIRKDKTLPRNTRLAAEEQAKSLGGLLVTKAAPVTVTPLADEWKDWSQEERDALLAAMQGT